MNKNIFIAIIVVLLVACVAEGYLVVKERNEKVAVSVAMQTKLSQAMKPAKKPNLPMPFTHGQKFTDNPLAQKAYLIAPVTGELSADAKKALTGWDMKETKSADGSLVVSLTPHDVDDVAQQYTVKPGSKLYFLEMTFQDESDGTDKNRGDDTGVLVDANGMVE